MELLKPLEVKATDPAPRVVAAAEFLLEGMAAHRKLSRSQEHGFAAQEKQRRRERDEFAPPREDMEMDFDEWQKTRRTRRGGLN